MTFKGLLKTILPAAILRAYHGAWLTIRAASRQLCSVQTCSVRGQRIQLSVSTEIEHFRADSYATKEPEALDWLDRELRAGDVLLDVGANIGLYTLYAASREPACTVYAFEPEAQNFARLCLNLRLNQLSNVVPCAVPIADGEGFARFLVGSTDAGASLHGYGSESPLAESCHLFEQGAVGVSIDTLVLKYGLPAPTLLKLDVDGLESKILAGAASVLRGKTIRSLLVEFNYQDSPDAHIKALNEAGYALSVVGESSWTIQGVTSRNFIFERQ